MTTRAARLRKLREELERDLPGAGRLLDDLSDEETASAAKAMAAEEQAAASILRNIGPKVAGQTMENIRAARSNDLKAHGSKKKR